MEPVLEDRNQLQLGRSAKAFFSNENRLGFAHFCLVASWLASSLPFNGGNQLEPWGGRGKGRGGGIYVKELPGWNVSVILFHDIDWMLCSRMASGGRSWKINWNLLYEKRPDTDFYFNAYDLLSMVVVIVIDGYRLMAELVMRLIDGRLNWSRQWANSAQIGSDQSNLLSG